MQFGNLHRLAPELRVETWIGSDGKELIRPLKLADLGDGYKIIFCFQHWCPGCHSRGFPTLKKLHSSLKSKNVGFAVIQTVFEGEDVNTVEKLRLNQEQYFLKMPFGHDVVQDGDQYPSFMADYRTAGTPWFTVIDPSGAVVFADFRLDADRLLEALGEESVDMHRVPDS
ncbi:hypothetical protein NBRC116590_17210 [Pelagimonas sp. KU-00592-HH]